MTRVAVVGLGLIGGSAALAFGARGWDRDPAARGRAAARGIGVEDELARAVEGADVVLLAVPSAEVPAALALAASAAPSAILTDAASWKRPAVEAAERLAPTVRFVAGHPMAGAAASGAEAATPDLFAGRPWLLVPTVRSDGEAMDTLESLVRGIGAVPRVVDAELHDAAMTFVSHLPLAVASALARVVAAYGPDTAALAGPGVLDTTRLAGTPRDLAMELAMADPDRLAASLEKFSSEVHAFSGALRRGDAREIERFFEEAREARKGLDPRS